MAPTHVKILEVFPLHEPERGCVVLDQPQHIATSRLLRLVFDTAALQGFMAPTHVIILEVFPLSMNRVKNAQRSTLNAQL